METDEEITLFKEMKNLYLEKKEILIKNKVSKLSDVDKRILENLTLVKKLNLNTLNEESKKLLKEIHTLNQTNLELIKHGILMSDKKLNIILKTVTPKGTNYSKYGKIQHTEMSTIIQDV